MRGCTTSNRTKGRGWRWSAAVPAGGRGLPRARRPGLGWLVVLAIAWPTAPTIVSAKTLQWKLKPDQRFRLAVERTVHQKSPTTDWTETISCQILWVVTGRDESGGMALVQTLTDVKHTLQFPGTTPVVYDSTTEGEPPGEAAELARYWKPLLRVERPLTLAPNGQLGRVESPPAETPATPATPAAPPTNATPPRPAAPRPLADANWTLPQDEVALGDSWADSHLVPWRDIADALKVTTSYTYQGEAEVEQQRLDKIVVQARWEVQPMPAAPRQLTVERQAGTGVIYFDEQAGYLTRSDFSQDLAIRVSPSQGDPIQAEISTVLKIRCQPVIPAPEVTEAATATE